MHLSCLKTLIHFYKYICELLLFATECYPSEGSLCEKLQVWGFVYVLLCPHALTHSLAHWPQ